MSTRIHPASIVDPAAQLADGVEIGPFVSVGPDVRIGEGARIHPHVVLMGRTTLGAGCEVFPGAVIGAGPQDLKFNPETRSSVEIGSRTKIRECVTIHPGTGEGDVTRVGSDCLLMAYSHVAHNCQLGNQVILANSVALAGHITIEDGASIGGLAGIHQFVRIGTRAFVGGCSAIRKDVVPYTLVAGNPGRCAGLNVVGLRRQGLPREEMEALQQAFRILFQSGLTMDAAREKIGELRGGFSTVDNVYGFLGKTTRGITRPVSGAAKE